MALGTAAFEMQRLATELIKSHSPGDSLSHVHGLRRAGIFAATAGQLKPAVACFEEARKLISQIASAPEATNTELLINEATACLGLDLNDEALALYDRAATAIERRSSPDALLLALVQNNIGCLMLRQRKYDMAIMRLTQANELQRNHPAADLSSRAEILHNLSLAQEGAGNPAAAKAYQEASLQLLEFVSDETRDKLAAARNQRAELPSASVTRESNLAERAYVRTPVLVSTQKKAVVDTLKVPLRTETINWL
jgi:tetratricopeptide (TPR) repeat protein